MVRNGSTPKTIITKNGSIPIDVPRDRNSTFEPVIISKKPFGKLLENVQYHDDNIYNFITKSSKAAFALINPINNTYLKDSRGYVKIKITSNCTYQEVSHNVELVERPLRY